MERILKYIAIPYSDKRELPYLFRVDSRSTYGKVDTNGERTALVTDAFYWTRDRFGESGEAKYNGDFPTSRVLSPPDCAWFLCDRTDMFYFRDPIMAMEFKLRWC